MKRQREVLAAVRGRNWRFISPRYATKPLPTLVIVTGLVARLLFIPYTAGSDIPQFAGFADTFLKRGLCFYKYSASYQAEGWPFPWPYPYGPLPALILASLRLVAKGGVVYYWENGVYHVYVAQDWVVATKAFFVLFDTLSAVLIYLALKRALCKSALLALMFYYLNPTTIYVSSIYGMFDAMPLSLILLSVLLLEGGVAKRLVGALAGGCLLAVATATKMNALYPALFAVLTYVFTRGAGSSKLKVAMLAGFSAGLLVQYLTFEVGCPSSLQSYIYSVLAVSKPTYNYPIVYSFNGLTNLATYLHDVTRGDYLWVISASWALGAAFLLVIAYPLMRGTRKLSISEAAYLSYLTYVTTYWRVNYQYLSILAGLAALYSFKASEKFDSKKRAISAIHAIVAALWVFMFPTSWWARVHVEKPNNVIISILDATSLKLLAQEAYLAYSLAFTLLGYAVLTLHVISLCEFSSHAPLSRKSLTPCNLVERPLKPPGTP